ncbi:non-canonical purine NTP pyrophosphatase, partial [Anoxybacillus sp. LAT_38]|nr:non-canonical purine NTP pyrophosphatase [Anoxybacillus sp. LAT_38]
AFEGVPEVVEDGDTFEANALKKAMTVATYLNMPAVGDDSGLEVDALEGRPGVYSARYAGEHASDEQNWRKLLDELR